VLGVLLYYGRAVDSTILVALSSIASAQATPTTQTMKLTKILLDYVATHPDAILTYEKSDMVLAVHSNALYLSKAQARSQAGGHFFLTSGGQQATQQWIDPQCIKDYDISHVKRSQCRIRSIMHQRLQGGTDSEPTARDGTQAIEDTYAN
jgi:hypothetical protein